MTSLYMSFWVFDTSLTESNGVSAVFLWKIFSLFSSGFRVPLIGVN